MKRDSTGMYPDLHMKYALCIRGCFVRIMEYEVYQWDDPFTHKNERQRYTTTNPGSLCTFYVHRTGKNANDTYKGGSFKGIDIVHDGGILIRSILIVSQDVSDKKYSQEYRGIFVEGPSCVVDTLCRIGKCTLQELESELQLIQCQWDPSVEIQIYLGARGGLTLKRAQSDIIDQWARAYIAPLRSAIFIPKKYKDTFFVPDVDRSDIKTRSSRYKEDYLRGSIARSLSPTMTQMEVVGYYSSH